LANPLVGGSDACLAIVVDGHKQIGEKLQSADGRKELESTFNFCHAGTLEDPKNREQFAGDGVVYFPVQSNDPSCTSDFCNIGKICTFLADPAVEVSAMQRLADLNKAMGSACTSVNYDAMIKFWANPQNLDRTWLYQTCSEWGFYQTCETGSDCPYTQGLHTLSVDMDICTQAFSLSPAEVHANIDRANNLYGGRANFQATRVMFPNGQVDPWKAGGVLESPKASVEEPVLMVMGASHHFWTHPTLDTDSSEVIEARQKIWAQLDKWLSL
jgi:serine protease 16